MDKIKRMSWIKRKMELLALSLAKVEKEALNQHTDAAGTKGGMEQSYHQGMLSDSLLRGEITMPVKELRWRLYKVLDESRGKTAKITGYDSDGLPIIEMYSLDKYKLSKIICDTEDSYPVEMVVNNDEVIKSITDSFGDENLKVLSEDESKNFKKKNKNFNLVGTKREAKTSNLRTLGTISFDDMVTTLKSKKTIYVDRRLRPKFEIEHYTKKMLVRKINEEERLLEFYISKYPDEFDRKSRLLISEINKIKTNPRVIDLLDIEKVGFITEKTIGAADGLEFEYGDIKFEKLVEFNGYYVIKFISKVVINGDNIFEKYKLAELEERYKNKEAK